DPDLFEQGDPWQGGLPLDLFATMRDERPCYWQALDAEPLFVDGTWVVSRHDDCVRIIRDTARFSNKAGTSVRQFDPTIIERGGRPTMVTMDGAEHQRNRTVTSRMFAPRAVSAWADTFRKIAVRIVERAIDKGRIDFITDLACFMPLDAISEMIGIPPEDREQVLRWTNMMTVPLDPHYTPTREDFEGALHGLWDYGLTLAERRRAEPDASVMTAIAAANADGRLSDSEVQGYMLQLAAAGNETTRNAIAFGLHALLLRPDQMDLLRSTGGMPESAVEEIIRWSSPTLYTIRQALEPIELHGQEVPAGARIALMQGAANFDPAVFDRPEEFDVMRAHNPHLGFGIANHVCLGIHVARLELRIMFEELLRRAKVIELDGEVEFVRDSFIHGVRTMPVRLARA
ncbi:MAG: cytochrome P450, partial [Sphingomonadales bacterium]